MNIWIDINKIEQIPFYIALKNELEGREHKVLITAEDTATIKNKLQELKIEANYIGNTFSVFGFFEDQSNVLRSTQILEFIKQNKVDVAFSLGSKAVLYTCINLNLNIILFTDDIKEKISQMHFVLYNISFIIPEASSERPLVDRGYDIKRIAKFKGSIQKDALNPSPRAIKDIASKIEHLGTYKDIKA